LLAC